MQELKELKQLYDDGILTKEEFKKKLQSKKEQLIITIEDPNSLKKIKYSKGNI